MRALQNFKGFHSNGRNIFPAGFTLGNISIDCGITPIYQSAFTFARVIGVSNTIDIQVNPPIGLGELITIWYAVSGTTLSLNFTRPPNAQSGATFIDITSGGTISGITNGHYVYFGMDSADPFAGTEFATYTMNVSNVSPGLTLTSLFSSNIC